MDPLLEKLKQSIFSAIDGHSEETLRHRRQKEKWSPAEVLEHLSLTYTATTKAFRRCLEAGRPLVSPSTLRQRLRVTAVLVLGYFPTGREAPEAVRPRGRMGGHSPQELNASLEAMDEMIAQCEHRYGKRHRVLDHPILGPLTGAQWRKFHWVHGRHHVRRMMRSKAG